MQKEDKKQKEGRPEGRPSFALHRLSSDFTFAYICDLRDQQEEKGKEDHPRNAEGAVAEVHRKERGDRREARLRGDELRLERVARDERAEMQREQHDRPRRKAEEQRKKRPRHERRARAEDGQRVQQRDEKGKQQRIALAHEQKAKQQLKERHARERRLRAQPAREGICRARAKAPERRKIPWRQRPFQRRAQCGIGRGGEEDREHTGRSGEKTSRQRRCRRGESAHRPCGKRAQQAVGIAHGVQQLLAQIALEPW